jgi:hypothetical protein
MGPADETVSAAPWGGSVAECKPMIDLSQSDDFQDSDLLAIDVDSARRLVTFHLEAYLPGDTTRERAPIILRFRNVRAFSVTAELMELQNHVTLGNVA